MGNDPIPNSLHPTLQLDLDDVSLNFRPNSLDQYGPSAQFNVNCVMRHFGGTLTYTANDLSFFCDTFINFAHGIKAVIEDRASETDLASMSRELVIAVTRDSKLRIKIDVCEYQPENPRIVASYDRAVWDTDHLHRWVDHFKSFSQQLDEWILLNRADTAQ